MTDLDLLGRPISEYAQPHPKRREKAMGYAALPGTGPEGETCKTCRHLTRIRFAKTYLKCGLMEPYWTSGIGTDIRARSPACRRWEREGET